MAGLIYMDHAATTPTHPEVWREMSLWFTEYYGNPATLYALGSKCSEAVEQARTAVADLIGAKPEEIYFTSGGTESDNWAIKGIACAPGVKGNHIITSSIEHHAVLEPCHFYEKRGCTVTLLPVDKHGLVDPDDVRKAITDKTILITLMHANNEVGTIEPIEVISKIAKERGIPFHTDAVQTVGKISIDVNALGCDMLSISAHKLYGPKGVGALYLRKGTKLQSFMHGGGQERNRRAGTLNVPGIVGLGKAAQIAKAELAAEAKRLTALRDRLRDGILNNIPDTSLNGHPALRLPNNVSVCVDGAEGEAMLLCLDLNRVSVSSGSACTTGSLEPSHVLLAMGIPAERAHGSLRFTLGMDNTEEQIEYVIRILPNIVHRLRQMSPTYAAKLSQRR
ncbi:MAG: cysteine desulfurase NifS [Planctomycetes bacterium]|nr:cysteine desulfurase NifS [Planctomycetota bacterium]MBM4080009.1 cysteine desulfurase NifS [Planctomycetota bacterium]